MKKNCPSCQGSGWFGMECYNDKCYKVICSRCRGKRKLDWIEIITGVQFGDGPLNVRLITSKLSPDNYLLKDPFVAYFIQVEFFNPTLSYDQQFKYLSSIINFMGGVPIAGL